jgi:hypothetical protein
MMRRSARVGAVVLTIVPMVIGAIAMTPSTASALGRPCAAGDVRVAVIVDFGDSSSVSVACVPAGSRDNGAQVLGARASTLGAPAPRFNASGLLCAIDNVPATGCGDRSSGRYAYWSYWHGVDGQWQYSNFGPAAWRVDADVVEGWRFQPAGAGNPSDPPPRASAALPADCRPVPPSTAPPVVAPAGTAPPAPGGNPSSPAAPGAGSQRASSPTTDTAGAPNDVSTSTTGIAGDVRPDATTSTEPTETSAAAARASSTSGGTDGSGSAPVGLVVGIALVATLGVGGALLARRRRATSP